MNVSNSRVMAETFERCRRRRWCMDFLAKPLQQVYAADLAPVKLRKVAKRQHAHIGLKHEFGRSWEALSQ